MKGRICPKCFAGTLVDYDGGTVCTRCRVITPAPAPPPAPSPAEILAFAAGHPTANGAIRRELGITPTRYFQLLNRAIDTTDSAVAVEMRERRDHLRAVRTGAA